MKLWNVTGVVKDWAKSGYLFGLQFTDMLTNKLEMSPQTARISGGFLDLVGGGGLMYMGASSAIATAGGVVASALAITTAPVMAVVTAAVGVIWIACSAVTVGIGIGLLDAAADKAALPRPTSYIRSSAATISHGVSQVTQPAQNVFFSAKEKLTSAFSRVTGRKAAPEPKKPAPFTGSGPVF